MKRLHVHVAVGELDEAIPFYSALFGARPTVVKDDYAKWLLDDPRVNFAVSSRGEASGVDHLGIQVEDADELGEAYARMAAAKGPVLEVGETVCCYARSEKSWIADPAGVFWEVFHTHGEAAGYGQADTEADWMARVTASPGAGECCGGDPETGA